MASDTPKATLTLNKIGSGFGKNNVTGGIVNTLKFKRNAFNASLAVSDKTVYPFANAKKLVDVVATTDYKLPKGGVTANAKYELGPKKYQVGATWDGKVANRGTTLKGWYSNKDKLVSGEGTINVNKNQKANLTFNQKKLLTAKYTLNKGTFTYEPSYNFDKKAPAIAITKKIKANTLKVAYDLKSEGASLEFNKQPFKLTVSTVIAKKFNRIDKPTVSAVFEKTYNF
mmetsp:Transcript_35614/g.79164  ORF Transcript_35614/g.79164 Transcript_35614/m.79164 type:complete len:228 (-) Transcript_35614:691-1374(-)|eukprot:CAMPEP_0202891732 /NCGR_PEP_ID=MMETSP1392-20130828/1719_1 /ASSEMBLY_ACC=CAM_ASM_000868 /TAXON_ID=225041 /ORGANISM="Chlamydomonas chlamydogama, Strain SAG 11-48b" /LENGTH=227 /DNA_ID=CAMNT_0049575573 /DNA_START=70 /DNA_END=753 /DNA_ORIENTATION=+